MCAHLSPGSGSTAQGANAVLLQHGSQMGNLLLLMTHISHPACDATEFQGGIEGAACARTAGTDVCLLHLGSTAITPTFWVQRSPTFNSAVCTASVIAQG